MTLNTKKSFSEQFPSYHSTYIVDISMVGYQVSRMSFLFKTGARRPCSPASHRSLDNDCRQGTAQFSETESA